MHPLERSELDGVNRTPWATSMDELGLVQADHRLRQGIIKRVNGAADGRLDARFSQALRVANGQVLYASVAVVHQVFYVRPGVNCLLECIESKIASQRVRNARTDDRARENV